MIELIEIKKREGRPLRLGRRGNPDRKLIYIQPFDLCRSGRREIMLLKLDSFRLQTVLARLETTPARITKKPKWIAWSLPICGTQRRLAQCRVKNFLGFARVTQHQETKAIKLRKILFRIRHAENF